MDYVACFVHAHHAGSLFEWHGGDYYDQRLKEFDEIKAQEEAPWKIALRKKLFRDVTSQLPSELDKAKAEWDKQLVAYGANRLHDEVCKTVNPDCPWNGKTIFG